MIWDIRKVVWDDRKVTWDGQEVVWDDRKVVWGNREVVSDDRDVHVRPPGCAYFAHVLEKYDDFAVAGRLENNSVEKSGRAPQIKGHP